MNSPKKQRTILIRCSLYNALWLLNHRPWIGLCEFLAAVRTVKDRNGISSTRYKPHHICACRVAVRAWHCNGTVWSACRSSSVYFSFLLFIKFRIVFHKYWSSLFLYTNHSVILPVPACQSLCEIYFSNLLYACVRYIYPFRILSICSKFPDHKCGVSIRVIKCTPFRCYPCIFVVTSRKTKHICMDKQ